MPIHKTKNNMAKLIVMKNSKWDKKAQEEWLGKNLVFDGITNQKRFEKANPKILWILKEANKGEGKDDWWDHREFHEDVSRYPRWPRTYQPIIWTAYGLLNKCYAWSDLPQINEKALINGKNVLEDIAIININKKGGSSSSYQATIDKEYADHKKFLTDQISEINPDIIINSSGVFDLFTDFVPEENQRCFDDKIWYGKTKAGKFFIHYYHPNRRVKGFTDELYCNHIFDIVKELH